MKDLLVLLGKRIHDLRVAKGWSQEEFAHICGVHRTYAGQLERGEKNLSFGNLLKVSSALGIAVSELLSTLEDGSSSGRLRPKRTRAGNKDALLDRRILEVQRLVNRLGHQRTELDHTISALEELMSSKIANNGPSSRSPRNRGK